MCIRDSVHMDVRGSGKSSGEFELLGPNEQNDLYDVIQWIAAQPWCNGKVGGLGQSYFCMSQWWMGIMKPPALACLAAYDGLNDLYLSLIHISEPTRLLSISYAVFCLKKKK